MIGGGTMPRPGEVSLAHNGVLFLDELPEFRKNVLEVLRQPLEDNRITIARVMGTHHLSGQRDAGRGDEPMPVRLLSPTRSTNAPARRSMIQRYRSRISGPLLDRIDIHVEVPAVKYRELTDRTPGETSAAIRERVNRARERPARALSRHQLLLQRADGARELHTHCQVEAAGERLLELAINRLGLSARAYTRILKVARTIADLDERRPDSGPPPERSDPVPLARPPRPISDVAVRWLPSYEWIQKQ